MARPRATLHGNRKMTTVYFEDYVDETDKAYCFVINGKMKWIPRSVMEEPDEHAKAFECQEWFARKEGLI